MVAAISIPSFHEDQPSALETALGAAAARGGNMMLIGQMQQAEQMHRQGTQDQYHDYMAGINALQQRNMALQQQETASKSLIDASNSKDPYALQLLRSNALTSGLIGNANIDPSIQAAQQRAQAENFGNVGKGLTGIAASGSTLAPGQLGAMLPNADGTPSNAVQGVPSIVQAAGINAGGRVQAAQIGAASRNAPGTKDYTESVTVDPANPLSSTKSRVYGVTPQATTVGPSELALSNKLANLQATNSAAHTDVIKGAAGNSGKPIIGKKADGSNGLVGASGQVY